MATIFMASYTNYRRDPRAKRQALALIEKGHDVVFMASRQEGEPNRETISGVDIVKTYALKNEPDSFLAYVADYLMFFFMLTLHLTLHPLRYRLIHIYNMPDFLVFAAWLPRLLGRPVIHDILDFMPELYMEKFAVDAKHPIIRLLILQEQLAVRFASAVLTVEDRLVDILVDRGTPRDKMTVVINLPDDSVFKPRPPQPPKPDGAPFVVAYHGTLAHRLGLDLAIQAVDLLREKIPNLSLRIIGDGEERLRLLELRDELNLQDMVDISDGFIPLEDIPKAIEDVDVGVVPLRISGGTDIMLPTKLLEYVSVGIPCIAPETGTICRYFDDSMVRFFEAEDVPSLAEAITDLYEDPEKRESLHKNATDKFISRYNWPTHKKEYVDLVERLLDRNTS